MVSSKVYLGVGGVAKEASKIYVGVGGVAKKVTKGYIGVGGVAKQFYSNSVPIDIGSAATNRSTYVGPGQTLIFKDNTANESGKITSIEIYAVSGYNLTLCEVATFYVVSGTNFTTRSSASLGTVTAGSKQTFSVNLDVQTGDYIGIYFSAGRLEADNTGNSYWYASGDKIPCTNTAFSDSGAGVKTESLYGIGST